MGTLVVLFCFAIIYLGVPWLIARLMRDLLGAIGIRNPGLTFLFFCGAFALVWHLRSDPNFWFHADQIEKYQPTH